jgi:hypothetical protein
LTHYSTYSEEEITPTAQLMLNYLLSPEFPEHAQFHKKYASRKYMKASVFCRDWALDCFPDAANDDYDSDKRRGRELCMFLDREAWLGILEEERTRKRSS